MTALTSEITPSELFFVRNDYDGPEIDPAQYVLRVDGEVENPLTLRLDDLRRMEQVTQTITLECAGNGRGFYSPPPGPLPPLAASATSPAGRPNE